MSDRTPMLTLLCGISKGRDHTCRKVLTLLGYKEGRVFATEIVVNGPWVGPDGTRWWGGVCRKHGSVFVREVEVLAAFEAGQIGLEASNRVAIFRSA